MFTHLHLHTEFSLLDGLSRIPRLLDRAREMGQEACAITDHGAIYGAIDFYQEARTRGIKPIIGVEAYVAKTGRRTKDANEKSPYHLTLLARDKQGYRNLLSLVTKANLEGYYYKPRMDRELFEAHGAGIIALSGCNSSEMHRLLMEGRRDEAIELARWSREVFDGYYFEVQENGLEEVTNVNKQLVELSHELDIPVVATVDSHYVYPDDAPDHDVLLCIGTNASVLEEKRMRMNGPFYYLQSEAELRARFANLPEAVDNTQRIADACDLSLEFGRLHLPDVDLPLGVSPEQHLSNLSWAGLDRRYADATQQARARLEYELKVVTETGFANYILVVYDFAQFARRNKITMGVRGSAAASLILYCLEITDIDPLAHKLVFERFLNIERREMPDVDLDFADDRRDEVFRYAAEKYGHDHVAQIITFGTLGAKAAIRDTGRALGLSYAETDRVARVVPSLLNMTIERALEESGDLKSIYETDPQVQKLVDTAQRLEGIARHASTHAAGIVISKEPLVEHVALQRPPRAAENELSTAMPTTQFAMDQVAKIGLLKMDILGLVNLTILSRATELIKRVTGEELDLRTLPDGDAQAYDMLTRGETFGVFQLESAGMRRYIQELRPESIHDLSAMVALYRPGPMQHIPTFCAAKHGRQNIAYPHPDLAEILDETYGVITYQDQVLHIARKFAGYSLGEADVMRKAMGKKIASVMRAERDNFLKGAKKKGYSQAEAEEIFELILPFAGYAFNKAHAVCYATIAYQTAFLKAHYPAEYLTAVLMHAGSHPAGAHARISQAVAECSKLGIDLLPPDVNRSGVNFALDRTGERDAIRFGLQQIKNVGAGAAESIVEEREQHGEYASIEDFSRRVNIKSINKRALESLAKAGALAAFGDRGTLLTNLDRLVSLAQREAKLRESGQATMFDLFGDQVSTPMPALELEPSPVPRGEELAWEKELLGVYVSEHPFTAAAGTLSLYVTAFAAELADSPQQAAAAEDEGTAPIALPAIPPQGRDLVIAGMIGNTRRLYTRDSRAFCAAEIEDMSGMVEVTVWPELFERTQEVWLEGNIVLLQVRQRERNGRLQLSVQQVELFQLADGTSTGFAAPSWAGRVEPPADGRPLAARATVPINGAARPDAYEPAPKFANGVENGSPPVANGAGMIQGGMRADIAVAGRPAPPRQPARTSSAPAVTAQVLRLELLETEDEDADRDRLSRLLEVLRAYPGEDEVRFSVRTLDGSAQTIGLGKLRVRSCDELTDKLEDVLREAGEVTSYQSPH